MPSSQAHAIRSARVAVGLTQDQLGRRVGLKGRAVYRWERDAAAPSRRNRTALVTAIGALNQEVAARLKAAFDTEEKPVPVPPAANAPARVTPDVALELAVLAMADELDLAPRRVRGALLRLCKQLAPADLTLDRIARCMEVALLGDRPLQSPSQVGNHPIP